MKHLDTDTLLTIIKMIDNEITSLFKEEDIHSEYLIGGYTVLRSLYAKVQIEYLAVENSTAE